MSEDSGQSRIRFVISAALLTACPVLAIIPVVGVVGWAFYAMPLLALSRILGINEGAFLHVSGFGGIPNGVGFLIVIPFWLITGACAGLLLYRIREPRSSQLEGASTVRFGFRGVVFTLGLQVVVGFALYWATFFLTA